MTISCESNSSAKKKMPPIVPPILLEKLEKKPLTKGEYHAHKPRSTPADNDSQCMSYQCHTLAQARVKSA